MADGFPRRDIRTYSDLEAIRRTGSGVVRRRVAQLSQPSTSSSGVPSDTPMPSIGDAMHRRYPSNPHISQRHTRETCIKPEVMGIPNLLASNSSRSLKRKKSQPSTIQADDRIKNKHSSKPSIASSSTYYSSSSQVPVPPPTELETPPPPTVNRKGKASVSKHLPHYRFDTRLASAQNIYDNMGPTSQEPVFRGPLAVAEYERMKKEIESLKESLHEMKRSSKRQSKKLEETKAELAVAILTMKENESEISILKDKNIKNEELLLSIESSVQCQICMDLLAKPFALSPCGHVLCLSCLQEWFRKAPPTLDDMDIDPEELTDPHYILMRSKSCPSCRAPVKHRPAPVFMVKAVATTLIKANPASASTPLFNRADHTDAESDDPWKGIFPSSDEDESDMESESESEDEDGEDFVRFYHSRHLRRAIFPSMDSTDSELEDEEDDDGDDEDDQEDGAEEGDEVTSSDAEVEDDQDSVYVVPRWAPPRVNIDRTQYNLEDDGTQLSIKLLQRGCTWDMLKNNTISYSHESGIVVSLPSLNDLPGSDDDSDFEMDVVGMNRMFLGWNIVLDEDDVDGETFLLDMLEDMKRNPRRWQSTPRPGVLGAVDIRRLVRASEVEDYDTTDTEVNWIDAEVF